MTNKLSFIVNGREYLFETDQIPATETLRETLHNRIAGIDLKRNCDRGICGGCTVIVNDRAVNACTVLTASCRNARILTFEGLSEREYRLYELFRDSGCFDRHSAYIRIRSVVMICIAQFYKNDNPEDKDFVNALNENIGDAPETEKILELIHQYRNTETTL